MTYLPTPPNLLPVDPDSGGQAVYEDWHDGATVSAPVAGALPVSVGQGWATRTAEGVGSSIEVAPGSVRFSTGAATAGGVVVGIYAVRSDSSMLPLGSEWHPAGRPSATVTVPDGYPEVAIRVIAPASYSADVDSGQWLANWTDIYGEPASVLTGIPSSSPAPAVVGALLFDPVLVRGTYDPGPTPPTLAENTFGQWVWNMLPELYQRVDAEQNPSYPLLKYLQGAGVGSDNVLAIAQQIATGDMTDPDAIPDAWLPWLLACLGVTSGPTVTEQRAALRARQTAPRSGTTANLEAYVAQFLTGSKYVVIAPSATPWMLNVSLIDVETSAAGGPPAILDLLRRSGKLPVGYDVKATTVQPAWDAVDSSFAGGTWDPRDSAIGQWAVIDSTGLGA